jgi:hypothetical protein
MVSAAVVSDLLLQELLCDHVRRHHCGHRGLQVDGRRHGCDTRHVDHMRRHEMIRLGGGRIILERAELVFFILQFLVAEGLHWCLAILLRFMGTTMPSRDKISTPLS